MKRNFQTKFYRFDYNKKVITFSNALICVLNTSLMKTIGYLQSKIGILFEVIETIWLFLV